MSIGASLLVVARATPARRADASASPLHDAILGVSWVALAIFFIITVTAFADEMFTKFSDAGPGYYFIMLGMPAFFLGWLCLVIFATFGLARSSWLAAALGGAILMSIAYANIG